MGVSVELKVDSAPNNTLALTNQVRTTHGVFLLCILAP